MGQQFSGQIRPEILHNRKIADYHPKQIDYIREKFVLMCDDDLTVGIETFCKLLSLDRGEGQRIFEYFDMDNSGKIDCYEFICGLAMISHANLSQKATVIFKLYDFDDSLVLNFDEMVVLVRCCLCCLAAMCGRRDIPSIQDIEEKVNNIFYRYDKDQDASINLEEFISIISKDREILQTLKDYNLLKSFDMRNNYGFDDTLPQCDSDLENEEHKGQDTVQNEGNQYAEDEGGDDEDFKISQFELVDRMRQGIEFATVKQNGELYEYDKNLIKTKTTAGLTSQQWAQSVKNCEPADYHKTSREGTAPDSDLELEYVYGYRCWDTRNNICYAPSGDLVYHTASLGIVLNKKTNTQKFFYEHYDDITCLTSFDNLIATGQTGKKPLIAIWDSKNCNVKGVIDSPLKKGISHLCFSNDGKKLAAVATDKYQSVAIYDVAKVLTNRGEIQQADLILAYNRGPDEIIFHICFDEINMKLALGCKKGIFFGSINQRSIVFKEGQKWSPSCPKQAVLCLTSVEQSIVGGTYSGQLVVFRDDDMISEKQAHVGPCMAICKRKNGKGILTGGSDGKLIGWDSNFNNFNKVFEVDLAKDLVNKHYQLFSTKIRAISEDTNSDITIGTGAGELVEIKKEGFVILNRCHYKKELWAVCQLKNRAEFVTIGEDCLLALFDINTRRMIKSTRLMFSAKCVDCDINGKRLAIGCVNGYVLVMDISTFQIVKTIKDRQSEITCIKYSPDGRWLSVGSKDSELLNYSVSENYILKSRMRSHKSAIVSFDFCEENIYIQSVCKDEMLVYSKIDTGKRIKNGELVLKDTNWASWSLPVGWPVLGIWPKCSKGGDINAVARNPDKSLLATADDYGMVKLFRYPCPQEYSGFNKYIGHSSQVTNLLFTENGLNLISIGGQDKSIMQWRVKKYKDNTEFNNEIDNQDQQMDELDEEEIIYQHLQQFSNSKIANPQGININSGKQIGRENQIPVQKQFMGEIRSSMPSSFQASKNCDQEPNQNLEIYHVFGLQSRGVRNMVSYSSNDRVVFCSARLGVVMDTQKKVQTFFYQHTDEIVSMAVHPQKKICATGQISHVGNSKMVPIYIWDLETKEILAKIQGYHKCAVNILKFSPDGSKLLTIGKDENNSLAIYDWVNQRLISHMKIDNNFVSDAAWKNENEFVTVGKSHIKFFETKGTTLNFRRGNWNGNPKEHLTSAVFCFPQNICFTGGKSGKIYTWQNDTCNKVTDAHSKPVRVLIDHKPYLCSGGDDGVIKQWTFSGKLQQHLDDIVRLAESENVKGSPAIRSIDIKKDGSFLVGTRGSEIIEIIVDGATPTINPIFQGHGDGKINALATHPMTSRFVTSGEDNSLRVYDASNKVMIAYGQIDTQVTALDWSSDGNYIIAGTIKGVVILMDIHLQELHKLHSSFADDKGMIQVLKISPDNSMIAFGTNKSGDIEIHSLSNNKLCSKGLMKGLSSGVTHIDWSLESNTIQANSDSYELKFFSLTNMKCIKSSSVRDQKWSTVTCRYGWGVQGIYPVTEGEGVQACSRAKNQRVLASGEVTGAIKLFKYPSTSSNSLYKKYLAHGTGIKNLHFMSNDTYLVSVGEQDGTIIVWKTDFGNFEGLEEDEYTEINYDNLDLSDINCIRPKVKIHKYGKDIEVYDQGREIGSMNNHDQLFEKDENDVGDAYQDLKPWQATIKPPRKYIKPNVGYDMAPNVSVKLHHIFGYHSNDVRNNVKMLPQYLDNAIKIVYFVAGVAINYNVDTKEQTFYDKHKEEITAMDLSADKKYAVTGERGRHPKIHIWDSETLVKIGTLQNQMTEGVRVIKISPDNNKLLVVTCDEHNSVYIFNLLNQVLITSARGDSSLIMDATWVNNSTFCTVGIKHFKRWELKQGRIRDKRGLFGSGNQILTCSDKNNGQVVVGTDQGTLQVWKGYKLEKELVITESCIDCLNVSEQYILMGGKDKTIYVWSLNYVQITKIEISKLIKESLNPRIRSIDCSADSKHIVIGTFGSEIFKLKHTDQKISNLTRFNYDALVQGHANLSNKNIDEIWGLATFNDGDRFATVSDDSTLRVWSSSTKSLIKMIQLNFAEDYEILDLNPLTNELADEARLRSVAISPNDLYIAVGAKDGTLRILSSVDFSILKTMKDRQKWIQDLKFSPNNQLLAVGSHDNYIDVYMVPDFKRKYALRKHSSFITHIDWSVDSNFLQTNCGRYELLYWDMTQGKQLTNGAYERREETWSEITCVLGWGTQGVFLNKMEHSEINMVARSTEKLFGEYYLLAAADDRKQVNLYKYPCLKKGSNRICAKGHSSFVTNVRFSKGDSYMYSTGGRDGAVFVWKVERR